MSKSNLLKRSDLLALMRHLADVSALRSLPDLQRQQLIDGLGRLLGMKLGWWFVMDHWRIGAQPTMVQQVLTANPDPYWVGYLQQFVTHFPVDADPYAYQAIRSDAKEQVWNFKRLIHDRGTRQKYGPILDLMKAMGLRDGALCALRLGADGSRVAGFSLHRSSDAKPMNARDLALAKLAISEIGNLIRRGHIVPSEPIAQQLSPRLKQVLEAILRGDSPRQMALAMEISIHTVREHIQRLYVQFGVTTREDLMARFIPPVR